MPRLEIVPVRARMQPARGGARASRARCCSVPQPVSLPSCRYSKSLLEAVERGSLQARIVRSCWSVVPSFRSVAAANTLGVENRSMLGLVLL
eukprot:COSAG02_NODE_37913_length_435_cov_1136.294643_1_plen_91_part_10